MNENLTQKYLDLAGVMFVALNTKGEVSLINQKGLEILGYEKDELIGKDWFETCLPEYLRVEVKAIFQKLMASEIELIEYHDNPVLTKSGLERFMSWHNIILTDEKIQPIGTLSSGQDITDRKITEEALHDSEARIRAILETAVDGIITINDTGSIETVNSAVEKLFGYTENEVIGKNVSILMPAPFQKEHNSYISSYLKTGEKKILCIGRKGVAQHKDGTTFPIRISVSEFFLDNKRMFTGIIHDISEEKELQQQILQSERLAVIGKMAAKVAHEVRNPLSSISLNAELLEDELNSDAPINKKESNALLKSMIREIDRVTSLTDEYLQFSRLPESQPLKACLNDLIEEMLKLLIQELKQKNIKLEHECLAEKLILPLDRSQIRRVLLNIIRNAIESMPKGGTLKIWTEKAEQNATIYITDSGIGIPEDKVKNIFNPFFTTKELGTGLGLAISQQIVSEHFGEIYCESKPGEGTTFRIELPLETNK